MPSGAPPAPQLSVIVCTYRRPALLHGAIASLAAQEFPRDRFEVLVVDNHPDGEAERVVEAHLQGGAGPIRLLLEHRAGLSHARNAGLRESRGAVAVFLDDDAAAGPGWLEALARLFADTDAAAAGGPIRLDWEGPRPAWCTPRIEPYFGCLDLGPERKALDASAAPGGGNFAAARAWLDRVGGFSPRLGLRGSTMAGMEEVDLCHRIRRAGGEIFYDPAAWVIHRVPVGKRRKGFVLRRAFENGRSTYVMEAGLGAKTTARASLRYIASRLLHCVRARDFSLELACRMLHHAGYVRAACATGRR